MPTSGPGQHGQPDEPQCYNCGTVGHWAVACPEPTRETPAGLAAWRSSSTPNQTHPKGQGPGSNKRSKGPIITKYGPPPPPPPPQSFGQGMNHMPPPPPGHHHHPHPPVSYPGQAPPYQAYAPPAPPPPPPPPAYTGSFPPAAYGYSHPPPPHHHPHPPYQPPPPHGAPHFGPPGYMGPPPALGPPPGGHFPVNRGDGHESRPSPHNQTFSRSPPPPKSSQPVNTTAPQNRSGSRQASGLAKPPSLPPKPPAGVTSHPLPPKPPKSHDQSNQQHEHRNKRKNDRHKGRDRRQSNDHHNQRYQNTGSHQHGHPNHSPENRRLSGSRKGQRHHGNAGSKSHNSHAGSPDQQVAGPKGTNNGRRASKDQSHRKPSSENVPRNRDDNGSVAKKANAPIAANDLGSSIGVEKVDGSSSPKLNNSQARSDMSDGSERRSLSENRGDSIKHSHDDDSNIHERQPKRLKTDASPRNEAKTSKSDEDEECIWDAIDVPREVDRRQQAERDRAEAKRRGSTASRASSQSSQSSDLNSLEAELLGRPFKQRSPEKPSTRQRPEHQDRFKPKRRPVTTNSAYSRRW
ncbi:DUF1212 domain membrane protein [Metarhizium robertsii ARSEF 23]|uniref:DUF1212 domain membrane protein n=1 Tax=Metarhizium robertsii (strain ARSEF 23 / ATCC MYA-3075) TaxID=655844 RepID=A0A0B2X9I8_METRA|nr:DUF1212 domain membrane protein [Metarhizium robertsii ARSEF 23]KHO11523.1 DUF1212 domain membrane protein [Metarhizium robertsii ARSEF 23]